MFEVHANYFTLLSEQHSQQLLLYLSLNYLHIIPSYCMPGIGQCELFRSTVIQALFKNFRDIHVQIIFSRCNSYIIELMYYDLGYYMGLLYTLIIVLTDYIDYRIGIIIHAGNLTKLK